MFLLFYSLFLRFVAFFNITYINKSVDNGKKHNADVSCENPDFIVEIKDKINNVTKSIENQSAKLYINDKNPHTNKINHILPLTN